jgi:CheY-like chemotaxis protein
MRAQRTPTILVTDDDDGHAFLIEDNLRTAGITSDILRFSDGQEVLDFLFGRTTNPAVRPGEAYILLLDIRMPGVDGVEVLRQLKEDSELRKLPVIILTTTDEPREVQRCHALACNNYIRKPVSFNEFAHAMAKLGQFLPLLELPSLQLHHEAPRG